MLRVTPRADLPTSRKRTLVETIRKQTLGIDELESKFKRLSHANGEGF